MKNIKSVKVNFLMNTILKMSSFLFPIITYPYISRILQPVGMGKVAFVTSIISYFSMFASMGIPTYGIRACAKVRDDKDKLSKLVHEIIIINSIILIITYISLVIFSYSIDKMEQYRWLLVINSITLVFNVFGVEWLYSALEEYTYISLRSIIFKIISILLLFIFVRSEKDYLIYGFIAVFASVGSNIFNLINIKKIIYLKKYKKYELKKHIKPILILFSISIAINIYTNLDTVMLGFLTNDYEVGLYNIAIKFKSILVSLVISLGTVLLPRISYYYSANMKEEIERILIKSSNFILILSISLTGFFSIFAKECIMFLAGESFIDATQSMIIITMTIPIIGVANLISYQILLPINKEKVLTIATSVGAIINLILNMILIRKLGALGASIATLLAEIIGLLIQIYSVRHICIKIIKNININNIIISLVISSIAVILFKCIYMNSWFLKILCGAIIYFSVFFIMLLVLKDKFSCDIIYNLKENIKLRSSIEDK